MLMRGSLGDMDKLHISSLNVIGYEVMQILISFTIVKCAQNDER